MVRGLDRVRSESRSGEEISPHSQQQSDFPATALTANPVFFRTYSRFTTTGRETWSEVCTRTLKGLVKLGKLTDAEADVIDRMQRQVKAMPSGRWLWVGGSAWLEQPQNFSGAYNCTSTNVCDWAAFALMMDLAMMGCGTGAILEPNLIGKLPIVKNHLNVVVTNQIGGVPLTNRQELTTFEIAGDKATITVGDSRQGWIKSYKTLLELCSDDRFNGEVQVAIDLSNVRPAGELLKGFGGMANPVKLPELYGRCATILNKAIGRQLNSVECCLLIDEAAVTIVAGNIRRSAGMRQFNYNDKLGATAKDNLWQQDENGNWRIDPERDALRMSNHTRVFHHKPTLEECVAAVQKQYHSGEGAIQWAGEAVARSNADLIVTSDQKSQFLQAYENQAAKSWFKQHYPNIEEQELEHRTQRFGLNPCHAGDTLVATNKGLIPILELVGQQFQSLVDLRSVGLEGVRLTDAIAFSTGVQSTYKVMLANGMQMRCTADHQHLTTLGWVSTKDLTANHKICIQKGQGNFGTGTISTEQSQMLGWLYGDGSIYKQRNRLEAVFYINPTEYAETFPVLSSAVKSLTGYEHQPSFTKGVYTFHSGSPKLNHFFEALGINSKESLPVSFFTQSREVIIGFLQGLFCADGAVSIKARHIDLVSRSRALLAQVQILLLNLGIRSSLRQKTLPGSPGIPYCLKDGTEKISQNGGAWRLLVYRGESKKFAEIIGFPLSTEKQQKLQKFVDWQPARIYSNTVQDSWFSSLVESVEEYAEELVYDLHVPLTNSFIANGCITHNCGEILGTNFHCNLSEVHLNQIDPNNYKEQEEAFTAAGLSVATLLNHQFQEPRYQYSRELDPIVGVSFTGLFDFFVHAFGSDWLNWWEQGRPATEAGIAYKQKEHEYLNTWRKVVEQTVWAYCDKHGIKRPNRCTTVQPSGTKSLLTGASPGWHPPKAQRFIRRITFRRNDPVAMACIDYGYSVIPSQSDKDEHGNLLDNAFDERCTEWLIEIPVAVSWADIPGADAIEIGQFSALTQMDFYMGVQQHYVRHNTSATIELREHEVDALGKRIYEAIRDDEGYISAALLARFDDHQTFPRLPFEPIDKATYDEMMVGVLARRQTAEFHTALSRYDLGNVSEEAGPAGCDSDKCLLPEVNPNS
jgi:ribonucleotide reductase, class II